jgi:hypothetical protein
VPITQTIRAVVFDNLVVPVSAWRYVCDDCGFAESFADSPMPESCSEFDASKRGWGIRWDSDENELARCPKCRVVKTAD